MIEYTIPGHPMSVNHMYGSTKNGRRFLKKEGKTWKENVALECLSKFGRINSTEPIIVQIIYFFPDNHRRDVSNYDKILLDTLSGVLYVDDSQIQCASLHKFVDKKNPRTMIRLWRVEDTEEAVKLITEALAMCKSRVVPTLWNQDTGSTSIV